MSNNTFIDPTTSETSPHILLHPSVLITINDHASRSGIRSQGPVLGALLGKHDGKQIIIEEAFEVGSKKLAKGNVPMIDPQWFGRMVQLHSEIHKELVLVGWYSFGHDVMEWHGQVMAQMRNAFAVEAPVFLLYKTKLLRGDGSKESLPFEMYEGVPGVSRQQQDVEGGMDVDEPVLERVRLIGYSLDTPADQAIGLADIMQGATAAMAIAEDSAGKAKDDTIPTEAKNDGLLPEEDELISALSTKADAIKMLQTRLSTITAYLESQPASYLTDASIKPSPGPDHEILRVISTLAASLTLTSPSGLVGYATDSEQAKTDGKLVELLAQLTQNVGNVKVLGKHAHVAQSGKRMAKDGPGPPQGMGQMFESGSTDWS